MIRRVPPLAALLLLVVAVVSIATASDGDLAAKCAATILMVPPLALLSRSVWPAVAGCALGPVAAVLLGDDDLIVSCVFAVQITGFVIGERLARRASLVATSLVAAGLVAHLLIADGWSDVPWVLGIFLLPFVIVGRIVRDRRTRIDELRSVRAALGAEHDRVVRLAAEAERTRIARDLEGVLAATVHAIEVELDHAPDPPTQETFASIHRLSSEAMSELRLLLGVLREPPEPRSIERP